MTSETEERFDCKSTQPYTIVGLVCILLTLAFLGFYSVGGELEAMRRPAKTKWSRIRVGDTVSAVKAMLGEPAREYSTEQGSNGYYVQGYGHKNRVVTGGVLIYLDADMVFYVWIDKRGYVEDTFLGTS